MCQRHVRSPSNLWVLEPHSLGIGVVPDPSATRACRYWVPKSFRITEPSALVMRGEADSLEIRLSPTSYLAKCGHPRINERDYGDPRENLTSRLPLFKVTQGHSNRHESVSYLDDFLLVTHSNHGPLLNHFGDNRRFLLKITNFPHLRVF